MAAAEPPKETPSEDAVQAVPLAALPVGDLLVWFMGVLAEKAWQGMGLVPLPFTGKIEKDLGSAKVAIDAYGALLDVARSQLEDARRREVESVLTTLRLNYVDKLDQA